MQACLKIAETKEQIHKHRKAATKAYKAKGYYPKWITHESK